MSGASAAAASPDWAPLRAAILEHDPNAKRLALIREIETWLVQPWDAALAACSLASPTLERAREVNALLNLVLRALRRDLGLVDGPAGEPRFHALAQAYQDGTLQAQGRRLWERANIAFGLWYAQRQHDPAVAEVATPTAQEAAGRAALDALIERQNETQRHAVPGAATPERMEALERVVGDYRREIAAAQPASALHVDLCFYAAHAAYALARGWTILGSNERAARLYAEAAILFGQGDRPDDATASADKARQLGHAVDGDLAAASRQDLRDLVERDADPLARARAQARLCALARAANDLFDAAAWADKAIANLVRAGFASPLGQASDALCDGWILRACRDGGPAGPLSLLMEVGNLFQDLLGARHARWVGVDAARAQETEAALAVLRGVLLEIAAQPAAARRAVREGLARYMPALAPTDEAPAHDDGLMARWQDLAARLEAIKREANAADARSGASALQALLPRAAACVADARATLLLPTIGLACQTEGYVRLRAGDAAGAAASAQLGETLLLEGLSPLPHDVAGHPQFDLLLELRRVRLQALVVQGDNEAVLALAQASVELVEARRWQVADPYQQGAFLSSRTLFYEMAVLACFRMKRWDGLLAAMELMKARAALLGRMAAAHAGADAGLLARLDAANAQLATSPPASEARLAAAEQRRLLLGLLAVDRPPAPTAQPALDVATLQASLDPDEAIVAWVWVAPSVVLLFALDATRVHAERVLLAPEAMELLEDHVALVRENGVTVRAFDGLVTRLADLLLPPGTRAFIARARRLILSPHRALHLLPLHAAVVDGRFLIERAAIRYVPNLSSLLLPARTPSPAAARAPLFALGIDRFDVAGHDWAALDAAEDEARAVTQAWTRHGAAADLLLGPQATVAAVRARLADAPAHRVLHLATHASSVFEPGAVDDPFAARLILQDGEIDALTISQWRLDAEVAVLSACDSGQRALGGRGLAELPGDDLFGLQAALFQAGVGTVVGALWPVDDRVAPAIMAQLHDGLAAGIAPDLALQAALRHYLAQPGARRGLYFWAPLFVTSLGRLAAPGQENPSA